MLPYVWPPTDSIMTTHYETLQLPENALDRDIRAAYRKFSDLCRPAINQGDEDAKRIMVDLNDANEILSNPARRLRYDAFLRKLEAQRASAESNTSPQQARIAELLALAKSNDNQEYGYAALSALVELVKLEPGHLEGMSLHWKISGYYGPRRITNSLGMKLVEIKPGDFMMGSLEGESGREWDETQHRVQITRGFFLGVTEVTQGQWDALNGDDPSDNHYPVEYVSWNQAGLFCCGLSQKEEKTYRLPTEAEWEYACRAGTQTSFHNGEGEAALQDSGWYKGNSGLKTHPVGRKKANAWGLYDMHGNVYEWCEDRYGDYGKNAVVDPQGPATGDWRVIRGGSWADYPQNCRSARRRQLEDERQRALIGFRVAMDLFY
jgi:formylglycine-generating enzyme required for sulfatase activity